MGPQVCMLTDAAGDSEQLRGFRTGFYRCLTSWADAAVSALTPVRSIPA